MSGFERAKWVVGVLVVMIVGAAMLTTNASTPVVAMQAATPAATLAVATNPTIPAPVAVQLDPKTTAYLVLDLTSTICEPRKSCVAVLPAAAALLKKARDAGAFVAYSDTAGTSTILSQVAPQANEPKVTGKADKFFATNLDDLLKGKGIKTVVVVGYVANGAVLYTAFGATLRGYTAVVATDGTGAEDPFAVTLTFYQLLNGPGSSNPQNQPLAEGRVTLSKSDLITFVPGAPGPKPLATAVPAASPQTTAASATNAATAAATTAAPAASTAAATTTAAPAASTAAATTAPTTGASSSGKPKSLADVMPAGPGRDLALENCGTCHNPGCVVIGQRTVDYWEALKKTHKNNVPSLSDADMTTLFTYLETNFNDQKPVPDMPPDVKSKASCDVGF